MRYSDTTIDLINKASASIFAAYGVKLIRGKGLCPFHPEHNPSFTAKPDKQGKWFWKCQSCQEAGGDIFSFVARMEGYDPRTQFRQTLEAACKAAGITPEEANAFEEINLEEDDPGAYQAAKEEEGTQDNQEAREKPYNCDTPLNEAAEMMEKQAKETALYTFLCRLFSPAEVDEVFARYRIGRGLVVLPDDDYKCTENAVYIQGTDQATAFPAIDTQGRVHSIKIIPFPDDDHHRIKDNPGAPMIWRKPPGNSGAFFGTHLLKSAKPGFPIAIVESEKTALLGALFDDRYIWIATAGLANLSASNPAIQAFKDFPLFIFPDADGVFAWSAAGDELKAAGYQIKMMTPLIKPFGTESKIDIGDLIVWEKMYNNSLKSE